MGPRSVRWGPITERSQRSFGQNTTTSPPAICDHGPVEILAAATSENLIAIEGAVRLERLPRILRKRRSAAIATRYLVVAAEIRPDIGNSSATLVAARTETHRHLSTTTVLAVSPIGWWTRDHRIAFASQARAFDFAGTGLGTGATRRCALRSP